MVGSWGRFADESGEGEVQPENSREACQYLFFYLRYDGRRVEITLEFTLNPEDFSK